MLFKFGHTIGCHINFKNICFGFLCLCAVKGWAITDLTFIHTNDTHAHLLPIDSAGQDCETGEDCLGGFARLQSFINEERGKNPNVILLDAGDRFSGTVFYQLHKEADLIPIFKSLDEDAMTLGNHEFDDNPGVLESFLKGIPTPCVLTNASIPENKYLKKRLIPSLILNKNGVKIGILGALTDEIKTAAVYGKEAQMKPTVESLQHEIKNLQKKGISIIVLVSHLGLDVDQKIAAELPEIDIIIGGHTHSLLSNTVSKADGPYPIVVEHKNHKKTLIVSTGAFGRYVGKLNTRFNDKGEVISFEGDVVPLSAKISSDPQVAKMISDASQRIGNMLNQKLQTIPEALLMTEGKNYCSENCAIGQALADMVLSQVPEADIVLINSGAIRSGWKAGDVRIKDTMQALPFDGVSVIADMKGKEIKSYLEGGLKSYQEGERVNALLQSAGLRYRFNPKTRTITKWEVQGKDPDENKVYHVILPMFIAQGGDHFPPLQQYRPLPKSMIEYVQEALKKSPYVLKGKTNLEKEEE